MGLEFSFLLQALAYLLDYCRSYFMNFLRNSLYLQIWKMLALEFSLLQIGFGFCHFYLRKDVLALY